MFDLSVDHWMFGKSISLPEKTFVDIISYESFIQPLYRMFSCGQNNFEKTTWNNWAPEFGIKKYIDKFNEGEK